MHSASCPTCHGEVDVATGVCPRCDTTIQDARPAAAAASTRLPEFPGYRVIDHLGEGGMGAVYLAEDSTLGRRVAIKVVSSRVAADAQSRSRFLREARTLATIEHPHVVRVYTYGEHEGNAYLVMEYVEGETLSDRIAKSGTMSISEALRITRQIIEALDAAWERRIIHRDIKPSNILIDRRNQVRVADFGLAKPVHLDRIDSSLTQSGYMLGTPHYVSPEQAQGKDVDFRTDIYSCGIMLYQMLTGERPFEGTTPVAIVAKHLHDPIPSLRRKRSDVPAGVERLLEWMTEKEPEGRPPSHRKLLEALDDVTAGGTRATATIPTATAGARALLGRDLRTVPPAVSIGLTLIAAGIILILAWPRQNRPVSPPGQGGTETRLVVAVAPFYGPDDDSAKEGRVMAALIERAIEQRLGRTNARVIGIDETKTPLRDHDAARDLGERLHANAVIWGEAFALRKETEIQPHVTIIRPAQPKAVAASSASDRRLLTSGIDPLSRIEERGGSAVKLQAEAPNQIELRKTSASGLGDVVLTLAGIHALETQHDPRKALEFLAQAPRAAETLRYQASAFLQLNRNAEARTALQQALALEPADAQTLATLGDLSLTAGQVGDALSFYRRAGAAGQPFTTSRGFADQDRLYSKETYRSQEFTSGDEVETVYLLAIDPATKHVTARYALPGLAMRFAPARDAVTITYNAGRDDAPEEGQLVFRHGEFDRFLWPAANLLWRTRSMRAGRVLAANFLGQFGLRQQNDRNVARFLPSKTPKGDAPNTLVDLERELRAAADRDPTQPWHLFFLALTLREQNRAPQAEAMMGEMLRRDYPGTPYYEFSWMMSILERMRLYAWSDAIFTKAVQQKDRLPQIIGGSTLIERLIDANFIRHAAMNHDMFHAWVALDQARRLTGFVLEGEDLAAAAWAREFRDHSDPRAEREETIVRNVRRQPLNMIAAAYRVDTAFAATVAAAAAFLMVLITLVGKGVSRVRSIDAEGQPFYNRVRGRLAQLPRLAVVITLTLAFTGAALWIGYLWANDFIGEMTSTILFIIVVVVMMKLVRIRPADVLAAIPWRERALLGFAWLLLIGFGAITLFGVARIGMVFSVPIGFNDAIGQLHIVTDLEKRLLRDDGNPALIYATAVANHYAGNRERAAALYSLLGSDPRAVRNAASLGRGEMPAVKLTPEELGIAYTRLRWRLAPPAEFFGAMPWPAIPVVCAMAASLVPLILILIVRPRGGAIAPVHGRSTAWNAAMFIIPGLYDLRRGHRLLGFAAAFSFALIVLPVFTLLRYPAWIPAVTPFGAQLAPNVLSSFPLPEHVSAVTLRLAPQFATLFWSGCAIAAFVAAAVHVWAIVRMVRSGMREREGVTLVPQAETP
jgi:predicted Ser/Thr protein kinase/tetratricopeptide (TPR) repeat protein